jgi:hypothetical protein
MKLSFWVDLGDFSFNEYFEILDRIGGVVEYVEDFDIFDENHIGEISDLDDMSIDDGNMMNGDSGFYNQITTGLFHNGYDKFNTRNHHFWELKWMCQSILKDGFINPICMEGIDISHFKKVEIKKLPKMNFNIGTIIPGGQPSLSKPNIAWGIQPGWGRLMVSFFLNLRRVPVLFFTNKKYNIELGGRRIKNIEDFQNIVVNKIKYPMIIEWNHGSKSNLDKKDDSPFVDIAKFDIVHSTDFRRACWVDDSRMLFSKIARNSFPLNVYIKSSNVDDFKKCCKRIDKSRKKFESNEEFYFEGTPIWFDKYWFKFELNFIKVDDNSDIPNKNNYKGFCVYTESDKNWNRDIFELYYFGHSQKAISTHDYTVIFYNCEHPSWRYTNNPLKEYIGFLPKHYGEII